MKKIRKSRKAVDVKAAAANDVQETPVAEVVADTVPSTTTGQAPNPAQVVKTETTVKPPAKNASAVQKGATYAKLAGSPSKAAVIACFGKSGYALSWVARAKKLGISTEELCERFVSNPGALKSAWETLTVKSEKKGA